MALPACVQIPIVQVELPPWSLPVSPAVTDPSPPAPALTCLPQGRNWPVAVRGVVRGHGRVIPQVVQPHDPLTTSLTND